MDNSVIELDVGGRIFRTYRSTLVSGSDFFRARLSEAWNLEGDRSVFIDRDPVGFTHVLNLLRDPNYPFPRETYGHELEFYGVGSPESPAGAKAEEDDDFQARTHELVAPAKTAASVRIFNLIGLIARGITNLKPEDNELGPRSSLVHPFLRFGRRAVFQQTCHTRVLIEGIKIHRPCRRVFALCPNEHADAWDDPRLLIRFRSESPPPRTRAEFFRLGMLSALLKSVTLVALPIELDDKQRVQPKLPDFDTENFRFLARLDSENVEALELAREEQLPVMDGISLCDKVFAESPGEISVSLDCIFKLCDGFSEECDAIPYCKDFLYCVALVVDLQPVADKSVVELVDVRMTANCYVFDTPVCPRPCWRFEDPNRLQPETPPPPTQLAFLDWKQESFPVEPGKSEIEVQLCPYSWTGVLHEIMFFVRQDGEASDDGREPSSFSIAGSNPLLGGCRTLVRVQKLELGFNYQTWVPWTERELVEAMADHDWRPSSPVYKLHYGAQGTDLRRIDSFRIRVTFWRPLLRASNLYVCVKSQSRMRRYRNAEWPDSLQSVTIV